MNWLRSFLSDRTQLVRIQGVSSDVNDLPYGVPQGSMLGPLLYALYTSTWGDIARSYGLACHFYVDDTQLILFFETPSAIEDCVRDINLWMLANKLKLNSDTTGVLVFSSSYCPRSALNNLVIVSETVDCLTTAKNIGVIFHDSLSMLPQCFSCMQVFFLSSSNYFQLRFASFFPI